MKNFIFLVAIVSAAVICLGVMPIGAGWMVSRVVRQSAPSQSDAAVETRRFRIDKGQLQVDGREVPFALATHLRGPLEPDSGSNAGQFLALNDRRSDGTVVTTVFGLRAKSSVRLNWARPILEKQDVLVGVPGLGFAEGGVLSAGVTSNVSVAKPEVPPNRVPAPSLKGFALPETAITLVPQFDAKGIAAIKVQAGDGGPGGQVNIPGELRNGRAYYSFDRSAGVVLIAAGDLSWLMMLDFGKVLVRAQ